MERSTPERLLEGGMRKEGREAITNKAIDRWITLEIKALCSLGSTPHPT